MNSVDLKMSISFDPKLALNLLRNFLFGLGFLGFMSVFLLVSIPIYLYRWLVIGLLAPRFRPNLGEPVTPFGATYGAEFTTKNFYNRPSRCALVTTSTLEGTVPFQGVLQDIDRKWIRAREKQGLRYPEFQQYVVSWNGFLFWKRDMEFSLSNHVKLHRIEEGANSEQFICDLIESLVNKPFPPGRSPWEVHIVHGYRNDKLFPSVGGNNTCLNYTEGMDAEMTVFILRIHHVLGDGFSVMSAEVDGLLGLSLDECIGQRFTSSQSRKQSLLMKLASFVYLPLRMIHDVGGLFGLTFLPLPWRVPDEKKRWKQLFGRTSLISVEKVGCIRKSFGVSFTSVVFSCMSAALSKNLERKEGSKFGLRFLPVSTALPLPRSAEDRYKLRNCMTGTMLDLPLTPNSDIDPRERLEQCENSYNVGKQRMIPVFFHLCVNTIATHLTSVVKLGFHNRQIPVGLSNFPGPKLKKPMYWLGKKMLNTDVVVGGMPGVVGIFFMALSYGDYFRVTVTAENGIMTREELDALIDDVSEEIDHLYKLAKQEDFRKSVNSND